MPELAFQTGLPEIIKREQGCQFTITAFVQPLESERVRNGKDRCGRVLDNIFHKRLWHTVKGEYMYSYGYRDGSAVEEGLATYLHLHNTEPPHQA